MDEGGRKSVRGPSTIGDTESKRDNIASGKAVRKGEKKKVGDVSRCERVEEEENSQTRSSLIYLFTASSTPSNLLMKGERQAEEFPDR